MYRRVMLSGLGVLALPLIAIVLIAAIMFPAAIGGQVAMDIKGRLCTSQTTADATTAADTDTTGMAADTGSMEGWVKRYGRLAFDTGRKYGIPYEAILGQGALESGWGQNTPPNSHNYFGIKKWKDGPSVRANGWDWQAYSSDAAGFDGYGDFIVSNSLYRQALQYPGDPHQYLVELRKAGYTTDDGYVEQTWGLTQSITAYIKAHNLYPPSNQVKPDRPKPSLNGGDQANDDPIVRNASDTSAGIPAECCDDKSNGTTTTAQYGAIGDAPARTGDYSWLCSSMHVCKPGDKGAYNYAAFNAHGYQCTWYAWIRLAMVHGIQGWTTGGANSWNPQAEANGGDIWKRAQNLPGWTVSDTPQPGDGASGWPTGGYGSYGHVAVVEEVRSDPSGWKIRISEGNVISASRGGKNCLGGSLGGCWNGYNGSKWMTKTQVNANQVHFFRYQSWKSTDRATGGTANAVTASAKTSPTPIGGAPAVVGWSEDDAERQFGGGQGPNNVCAPYAYGQCTWWACMREHMIGNTTGSYWGNGEAWVRSAVANGWKQGVIAPGGVVSFTPGSIDTYADGTRGGYAHHATAGHVAVVESVDTTAKTFTTSEKGSGSRVYSHTYSYAPLPGNMSAAAPPSAKGGATAIGGSVSGASAADTGQSTDAADTNCKVADQSTVTQAGQATIVSPSDGIKATPEKAKAIAKSLMPTFFPNASSGEYDCVVWVFEHESGWKWDADNPRSDAYGIPQANPGDKMADMGSDWRTNATTQLKWGLTYMKERYGTPCQAKSFWQAHNWY